MENLYLGESLGDETIHYLQKEFLVHDEEGMECITMDVNKMVENLDEGGLVDEWLE